LKHLVPARPQAWERTAALVERIAADPAFLTVEDVAREAGATSRQLQRRF
jgi:AraC-like DNA-binding protein